MEATIEETLAMTAERHYEEEAAVYSSLGLRCPPESFNWHGMGEGCETGLHLMKDQNKYWNNYRLAKTKKQKEYWWKKLLVTSLALQRLLPGGKWDLVPAYLVNGVVPDRSPGWFRRTGRKRKPGAYYVPPPAQGKGNSNSLAARLAPYGKYGKRTSVKVKGQYPANREIITAAEEVCGDDIEVPGTLKDIAPELNMDLRGNQRAVAVSDGIILKARKNDDGTLTLEALIAGYDYPRLYINESKDMPPDFFARTRCEAHKAMYWTFWGVPERGPDRENVIIDHINRDKSDFRLCNLRPVPPMINKWNETTPGVISFTRTK